MFGVKTSDVSLDGDGYTAKYFNTQLQDLMLTFPTLLLIQNRKEEALYWLERCIVICEKYKFLLTRAKLTLMIASLYLNDKDKSHDDVWEKAHEALNMFVNLQNREGRAESNFLLGMILRKKHKRALKSDSLRLKKQNKSDNIFELHSDFQPKMHKSSSGRKPFKEDDKNYLEVARQHFIELKHQYGIARVSLAIAIRRLEIGINTKE